MLKKTNIHFSSQDNIPVNIPELQIANRATDRTNAIKFLGVLLDENVNWKSHICSGEMKTAKNIGLLYCEKYLLDESSIKTVYFSYIYSFLNYANISWESTYQTKLKTVYYQYNTWGKLFLIEINLHIPDLFYDQSLL